MTINNPDRSSPGFWLSLINSFRVAWKLLLDGRVPWVVKLIPLLIVLYVVSPIDIIPDVIPVFGQLDDLAIVLLGIQLFIALSPRDLVKQYRDEINGVPPGGDWTVTNNPPGDSNPKSGSSASKEIIDG